MTQTLGRPAAPAPAKRFSGLLPARLLRWRRPAWWQELLIIAVGYGLYSLGRNAIHGQRAIGLRHGRTVQHLQDELGLDWERGINHLVARTEWLAQAMDYYYSTLHFAVTLGVLAWLFARRSHVYRGVRTVLFATTLIGLLGFYLYPLAPPRLLPQFGYVDTLAKYHTWGSLADPDVAKHSNQFAAMPSLHIAWALWCGIAIFVCARRGWVRWLGVVYPVATLAVIVGTANHFVLDAVGGAVVLALGFGVQWLFSGHGAFEPPHDAPDFGLPDPELPHLHRERAVTPLASARKP